MEELSKIRDIRIEDDFALFSINPKIYPLEIVYYAAYIMIDKAFIILDGDPEEEIKVELRRKKDGDSLKDLVIIFNEELLNYSVYVNQTKRTEVIREILLGKALGKLEIKKDDSE